MKKSCKCGEPIWLESRWNGLANVPVFKNLDGVEISCCPACGESFLRIQDLEDRSE